jgi:hypothetical protein
VATLPQVNIRISDLFPGGSGRRLRHLAPPPPPLPRLPLPPPLPLPRGGAAARALLAPRGRGLLNGSAAGARPPPPSPGGAATQRVEELAAGLSKPRAPSVTLGDVRDMVRCGDGPKPPGGC